MKVGVDKHRFVDLVSMKQRRYDNHLKCRPIKREGNSNVSLILLMTKIIMKE